MSQALTDQERKVIDQIQKLLNLAAKNDSEAEAAEASKKAQELLTRYNLDAAVIERESGKKDGRREQARVKGGFYQYQRDLWKAVAGLHFCMYWTPTKSVEVTHYRQKPWWEAGDGDRKLHKEQGHQSVRHHALVGRIINTTAARHMAQYLEQVIQRIVTVEIKTNEVHHNSAYATSFREGMAQNLIEKITERFKERMHTEELEKRRAEAAATAAGRPEQGMSKSITLSGHWKSENDANYDFIYGEGASAKFYAERAEKAQKRKEEEEAYTKWAADHPEEAAANEAERRKGQRKRFTERGGSEKKIDWNAYYSGYDAAKGINIDPQVDTGTKVSGKLSHG